MSHRPDSVQGIAAGLLAGLAAAYVMEQFQAAWSSRRGDPPSSGEPATSKLADKASRRLLGRPLDQDQKQKADPLVHYGTGAALGALYGFLAEDAPGVSTGGGTLFGLVTAIGLDDGLVPLLDLGPGPEETPRETHLYSLASHLVFGVALEGARRLLRVI